MLMFLTNGAYAVFFASHILHTLYRYRVTNQPTPGFLTNTTTPPQVVWAYSSGCSLRGLLTCATSIHRSPRWRRPRGRPRQSWLRTIESNLKPLNLGLHFALRRATDRPSHRGDGYALRACHLMMMMMKQQSVTFIHHSSTDTIHLKT